MGGIGDQQPQIILEDDQGNKKQVSVDQIPNPSDKQEIQLILDSPHLKAVSIQKKVTHLD